MKRRSSERQFSALRVVGANARGIIRSRVRCAMVLQRPAEARENIVSCKGICRYSRGMAGSKRKTCLKSGAPIVNCPKKDLRCAALVLRRDCSSTDLSSSRAQAMLVLCPVTPGVCMISGVRAGPELSFKFSRCACSALSARAHTRISFEWHSEAMDYDWWPHLHHRGPRSHPSAESPPRWHCCRAPSRWHSDLFRNRFHPPVRPFSDPPTHCVRISRPMGM